MRYYTVIFLPIPLFIFSLGIWASPIGWYNKLKINDKVIGYSVCTNPLGDMHIVTSHLRSVWGKNKHTQILLKLHRFNGSRVKSSDITETTLWAAKKLFPMHISIATFKKNILVVWQETSRGKEARTRIKYIFSEKGPNGFGAVKELDDSVDELTTILPKLEVDQRGDFHLFYQKETSKNVFTMFHSKWGGSDFDSPTVIVEDIEDIGHGAFFPSAAFNNNNIDIIYQNRIGDVRKDEIFHVQSFDRGDSFSSPKRVTDNDHNDFSPNVTMVKGDIQFVWQSRINNTWSIVHSERNKKFETITRVKSNSYSPHIVYLKNPGRVVTWNDFRRTPPQIYSVFLDKKDIKSVSTAHNVSRETKAVSKPEMIRWNRKAFLFYIAGRSLFAKQVDSDAKKVIVSSKTHPENKVSRNSNAFFSLTIPKDPSGLDEIAWLQDNSPKSIPEVYNFSGSQRRIQLRGMKGGDHYLHVRYRDKIGNESKTTHYHFIIDAEIPDLPVISSPTHRNGGKVTNPNLVLDFFADDDSSISYYQYSFSKNRGAKLDQRTVKNQLRFYHLKPDVYFFKLKAIDLAGNSSGLASYRVEIIASEDSLSYYTNIESQQLREDFFRLEYLPPKETQKIQKSFFTLDSKKRDPFQEGNEISFKPIESGQSLNISMKDQDTERLYTISIGLIFLDGTRKVKTYSFEYLGSSHKKPGSERAASQRVTIMAKMLDPNNNLYEISFKAPKEFENKIKGYAWHLIGRPSIPQTNKINSVGGPEYIYNLDQGIYYLAVLPIFKKGQAGKNTYSYLRIEADRLFLREIGYLGYFFISLALALFFLVKWQYHQILFYFNSILRSSILKPRC